MKKLNNEEFAKLELSLSEYQGDDRIVSSIELGEELKKTQDSVFSVSSKLPSLDRILENFEMGELVVVTGPTGEGKTTLTMTITKNLALQNIPSVWFSLEVTPRQLIQKLSKGSLPLFYLPREITENHLDWIEKKIIEAKVKNNIQVVFIDHIHQIFSLERSRNNISLEIGDMVARVKQMCIQHNIVIFLIAHTKDNQDGSRREPTKESIRDSGLISRLADIIIGVWRVRNGSKKEDKMMETIDEEDTWAKIRVFKNRRSGKLGSFLVEHKDHYLTEIGEQKVEKKVTATDDIKNEVLNW